MRILGQLFLLYFVFLAQARSQDLDGAFVERVKNLKVDALRTLPVHDGGRLKPIDTLARETLLYVTGSRKPFGMDPLALFLVMMAEPNASSLPLIEIRTVELRPQLGLNGKDRFASIQQIQSSGFFEGINPILEKQRRTPKLLDESESAKFEVFQQASLMQAIFTGQIFLRVIDFGELVTQAHPLDSNVLAEKAKAVLNFKINGEIDEGAVAELEKLVRSQTVPELFQRQLDLMKIEVALYRSQIFWIAAILYLIAALVFWRSTGTPNLAKVATGFLIAGLLTHSIGFALRVYITGFAPVTNMYGTMLWVAFGVALFASLLLKFYGKVNLTALLFAGSALVLIIAEGFPLILNPGLDPVVAVLRSNLWLTIHVLTITISYAALTITMLLGNYALIRQMLKPFTQQELKELAHHCYRMIQLGVFLLTVGIVLGGVWADYSWGRFWGWDPKETWALIADLGYLAILHARFTGWLTPAGVLFSSPIAYLLVVMAWYGVNFVLAAGLHSYGFSKGGALWVLSFVSLQLVLVLAAFLKERLGHSKTK